MIASILGRQLPKKGVLIAVISEGMEHLNTRITEVYLDSFDYEVLDDYNEMIVVESFL